MARTFREFIQQKTGKPWKAKKADVLQFWHNIKPDLPLTMEPVSEEHRGTRFRSDGLRVTGSPQFINSIMSRLKDMLQYEVGANRLDVEYRQIASKGANPNESAEYVFYVHLVKDEPETPKIDTPSIPG